MRKTTGNTGAHSPPHGARTSSATGFAGRRSCVDDPKGCWKEAQGIDCANEHRMSPDTCPDYAPAGCLRVFDERLSARRMSEVLDMLDAFVKGVVEWGRRLEREDAARATGISGGTWRTVDRHPEPGREKRENEGKTR